MVIGRRDKSTVNLCQSLGPAKVQKFSVLRMAELLTVDRFWLMYVDVGSCF